MRTPSPMAVLASIATLQQVQAYFIIQGAPVVTERIDPIVSFGKVASHVHNIVGANNIDMSSTYESLQQSSCTTLPVTKDLSAYWQPQLYYYNPTDKTYQVIPSYAKIYYLQRPGPSGGKLTAFPPGFRMVAGSPSRSSFNAANPADRAINFVCEGSGLPDRYDMLFGRNCPGVLRAQTVFPACWDGVNLYKADGSHMSYPLGPHVDNGDCPASHPVHFITMFHEFVYEVNKFPFNAQGPTWVFATGDATGYSLHGDFQNGWDVPLLQRAIDECSHEVGGVLQNCPPLAPYLNSQAANACRVSGNVIDEDVGLTKPISKLPGCNPLYTSGPRPTGCTDTAPVPSTKPPTSTPATGYTYHGCVAEAPRGRLLSGASMSSDSMTAAVCTAFCSGRGFEYAGIEYGRECWCGAGFSNGGTGAIIASSSCSFKCPGNSYENCGGGSSLSLYRRTSNAPVTTTTTRPATTLTTSARTTTTLATTTKTTTTIQGTTKMTSALTTSTKLTSTTSTKLTSTSTRAPVSTTTKPATTPTPPTSSLPAGWTAIGCIADKPSRRTLSAYSFHLQNMTYETCLKGCQAKKYAFAGLEYSHECWCANSMATTATSTQCTMPCGGDKTKMCGGPDALTAFKYTAPLGKRRSVNI